MIMAQTSILQRATLLVAGLMGVAGVASAAAASHGPDPRLMAAISAMCLAHAPLLVALYAGWDRLRMAAIAAPLIAAGTILFSADLFLRQQSGHGLFAMSAPLGGMLMMAGWLSVAASALLPNRAD